MYCAKVSSPIHNLVTHNIYRCISDWLSISAQFDISDIGRSQNFYISTPPISNTSISKATYVLVQYSSRV